MNHPKDYREQCYRMFVRWRTLEPNNYTYIFLGEALERESQNLIEEFVKEVERKLLLTQLNPVCIRKVAERFTDSCIIKHFLSLFVCTSTNI